MASISFFRLPKTIQMTTTGSKSSYRLGNLLFLARRHSEHRAARPPRPKPEPKPPQTNSTAASYATKAVAAKRKENTSSSTYDGLVVAGAGDQGEENREPGATSVGGRHLTTTSSG